MKQLYALVGVFAYLSILTVGGGMAAFPEMKTLTVEVYHWLTFPQLIHLYSVGQLAPGPNMMVVAAIGEWVAGPLGALLATVSFILPTAVITLAAGRLWERLEGWRWHNAISARPGAGGDRPAAVWLSLGGDGSGDRLADGFHCGRRIRVAAAAPASIRPC